MNETAFVITWNDIVECVVLGTEAQAVAVCDELKARFAERHKWFTADQLARLNWKIRPTPLRQF